MADLGVFSRYKSYGDYETEARKEGLAAALAAAQIRNSNIAAQAALMKAAEVDADKLGERAFLKAVQGIPITPQEDAALQYKAAKEQTIVFNPATGARESKPDLYERAGLKRAEQGSSTVMNPPPASRPVASSPVSDAAQVVELFGGDGAPVNDGKSDWDIEYENQLKEASGNPKLQQTIKENYAKSKISMTGDEAKNAGFADRMLQSNPIVEGKKSAGMDPVKRFLSKSVPLGNYVVGGDYQSFNQAQRDFINAQLRRESGAVISDSEFDNAEKQYFPVPGDSEQVLKQKKANREAAVRAMVRSAGPAYKQPPTPKVSDGNAKMTAKDRAESIFNAKKAIKAGKNAEAVKQRLIDAGIDPKEAGL